MQKVEAITTPLPETPDADQNAPVTPEQSSARRSEAARDVSPQRALRFDIPPTLRPFQLFPFLPVETQDAIWEATLEEPGINFMSLVPETNEGALGWFVSPLIAPRTVQEEVALEPDTLRQPPCTLEPVIPEAKGDESNYMAVREQIQKLHIISQNSATFIRTFLKSRNVFRNRRCHILSVHPEEDVFFINYINESDRYNGAGFSVQPVCAELDRIVQVAVRFNHVWKMPRGDHICPVCFWVHTDPRDKSHYPRHLYQFLARCFPNLRQVWIVDYLMRPKLEEGNLLQSGGSGSPSAKPVLKERYVQYTKATKHTRHTKPEKVRFGVLGVKWDVVDSPDGRVSDSSHKRRRRSSPRHRRGYESPVWKPGKQHQTWDRKEADLGVPECCEP